MRTGKLFVIGVGPGDPELLTLKGARLLGSVGHVVVPRGREGGGSLALSIARGAVDLAGKEIVEIHFPMVKTDGGIDGEALRARWDEAVEAIAQRLLTGNDVAFLTLGDPTVYSTFFYLHDRLVQRDPLLAVEIVPGVSSITASAARARLSLGLADGTIAILPASYGEELKGALTSFDTIVLMKVYRVFDQVRKSLEETGLLEKAVYVARAGMEDERIVEDLNTVKEADMDYFSLVIVRK